MAVAKYRVVSAGGRRWMSYAEGPHAERMRFLVAWLRHAAPHKEPK